MMTSNRFLTEYASWCQLTCAVLVQAISAGCIFSSYSLIAASLKSEFASSNMVSMLGLTVISLCSAFVSPTIGSAIDRFSARKLMLLGLSLFSAGFLLLSVTTSMTQAVLIYAVFMAISSVLLGPIATSALLTRWFTAKRGLALGIAASGGAIGGLLFPPLIQSLIDGLEWRVAFRYFGMGILLIAGPIILLLVQDYPADPAESHKQAGLSSPPAHSGLLATAKTAFRDNQFWLIAITMGILFCGPIGVISNLIQIAGDRQIETNKAVYLLSIFAAAGFTGKLIFASLVDRVSISIALFVTLTGIGVGFFTLMSAQTYATMVLACVTIGLFSGTASPLWSLLLASIYGPDRLGKMMGLMNLCFVPFTLSAPPLFGLMYDLFGSYDWALLGYLGLLLVAAVLVIRFNQHHQRLESVETTSQ